MDIRFAVVPNVNRMNVSLIKSAPKGNFAEVSCLMRDWETKIESLLSRREPIKYDMYPMPGIPAEIKSKLQQLGYEDLVLEHDRWQHYLVPVSN